MRIKRESNFERTAPEAKMLVSMDPDLQRIAEIMQTSMAADKLVSVATALGEIAPILWGCYERAEIRPLSLDAPPIEGSMR